MEAAQAYLCLMEGVDPGAGDPFDAHVVASLLALGLGEAAELGCGLSERVGLDGAALRQLTLALFPKAVPVFSCLDTHALAPIGEEERSVRDLLLMFSTAGSALARPLASMIARRCASSHHLWQDLGLRDRSELSRLMQRHFDRMAQKNSGDMKWKKFLYRMVCRSEGFSLCAAPVCSDCNDFESCFGAEDGEALLARLRNGRDTAATSSL